MIHQYRSNGHNIVLDVNSGSVHVVDDLVYDILKLYKTESKENIITRIIDKYQQPIYAGLFEEPISEEIIKEAFEEFEYDGTVEEFIRTYTSPVRQVKIGPMLVERKLQEFGYERVDIEDPRITGNKEWMESLEKAGEYSGLNIVGAVRFTRIEDKWVADLCHHTTYRQLLDSLKEQGFSLPTADEWEYLCGGGCRTLFPWGDSFDFSMHLYHFEDEENKNTPYDMEEPNFFGLSIAYNPYKSEIVKADKFSTKGGDGGCNICGGMGPVMGYLPCSPYFTSMYEKNDEENDMDTEPDNDYSLIRRIIRIDAEDVI